MTTRNSERLTDPEIERTMTALAGRHPAFLAHERFVRDRLAELAQRAYQHGANAALLSLMTADDVAAHLGVTPAWARRMARRHDIGWNTGRDWVFTPDNLERLAEVIAANKPGRPRRTDSPM